LENYVVESEGVEVGIAKRIYEGMGRECLWIRTAWTMNRRSRKRRGGEREEDRKSEAR
jgi:hypothetical protein